MTESQAITTPPALGRFYCPRCNIFRENPIFIPHPTATDGRGEWVCCDCQTHIWPNCLQCRAMMGGINFTGICSNCRYSNRWGYPGPVGSQGQRYFAEGWRNSD